jgi:hypothetical protein
MLLLFLSQLHRDAKLAPSGCNEDSRFTSLDQAREAAAILTGTVVAAYTVRIYSDEDHPIRPGRIRCAISTHLRFNVTSMSSLRLLSQGGRTLVMTPAGITLR